MINKIFGFLIIIGIIFSFVTGNQNEIINQILGSADTSFNMITKIFPLMALWLGIMNIAQASGLLDKFTKLLKPLLKFLFPTIPPNHESLNYISANMLANMFGLGNASTPMGIKAMKSLQSLNNSDTASDSMITFLMLNTIGFTIVPTTIISLRMAYKSVNPSSIIPLCLLTSCLSLIFGILINVLFRKWYKK